MRFPKMVVPLCAVAVLLSLSTMTLAQATSEAGAMQPKGAPSQLGTGAANAAQSAGQAMQGAAQNQTPAAQNPTPAPQNQTPAPQVSEPGQAESQVSAPLRVMVGKSLLVTTTDRLRRVSVTDPAVADALVVTPTQVLVHGRSPGEVSLILWDEQERSRSFDLRVDADVTAAAQEIHRLFPSDKIDVEASRNAIVVSGHVATKEDSDRVGQIASAYTKNVVNVLTFGPVGAQEVLLEVHFAEIDRTQLMQLGMNLFSTGAANTFGQISTQQFGPPSGARVGSVPQNTTTGGSQVTGSAIASGAIGSTLAGQPGSFGFNDLLNVFLFRSDLNLGAVIRALQQKNVLQILAEPNLIAVNGKEASFLAGGEFPFPVVQAGGGFNSVTIQFKEFGVRLNFTPLIMPNGNIHLQVKPEVSALDFSNALTISGFVIPALSTRRANTEFEIQDGQSFVIAGLMDNRLTDITSKVPGLGDIPILGTFFKSKSLQKTNTELMVLVTAHKINPSAQPATLPSFPQKFMQPQQPGGGSK